MVLSVGEGLRQLDAEDRRLITVQAAMLIGLGFMAATLLLLLFAPAFWARAVRLTNERLKASMPITETEIRADRDRLKAEHAVRIHRLETQIEHTRLSAARQLIEINRRDARVNALETEAQGLKAELEEAINARRVLELTVADRLPRVEQRLLDAKQQLEGRDSEIDAMTRSAERQARALAEAKAIHDQQSSEIARLTTALSTAGARNTGGLADPRFDAEVALKSELEALRAQTREQAALIGRLQAQIAEKGNGEGAEPAGRQAAQARRAEVAASDSERLVPRHVAATDASAAARDIAALRREKEAHEVEISRLKAALAIFEAAATEQSRDDESRIALKARLSAATAEGTSKDTLIEQLRGEIAALREQASQQLAHFAEEMKRLGAGTLPASDHAPQVAPEPVRETLASRVAYLRRTTTATEAVPDSTATAIEAKDSARTGAAKASASDETAAEPRSGVRPRLVDRLSSLTKA